ncbi:hypothetical protein JR338_04585 [Chloroflexota bacterium]|nr:hypothetical protein JR338_04585 [Chloroflexota bacterium]
MNSEENQTISQENWDLWYQDRFELGSPRQIELSGQGLANGLVELWARHLHETVQPTGLTGFAKFDMWWKDAFWPVLIFGDEEGQVKIRQWVYDERVAGPNYLDTADRSLLQMIAETHAQLLRNDLESDAIVSIASETESKTDFMAALNQMREGLES